MLRYLERTEDHVFVDELHMDEKSSKTIYEKWSEKTDQYLWIVSHRNKVNLGINLRNVREIQEVAYNYKPGSNHPRNAPTILKNIPSTGIKLSVVNNTSQALNEVKELVSLSSKKKTGILYHIVSRTRKNSDSWFKDYYSEFLSSINDFKEFNVKVYSRRPKWKEQVEEKKVSVIEDQNKCLEHLSQSNSILVVDNTDIIEGFEWPIIILDARALESDELENCKANDFLRAMVQCIAIPNPKEKESLDHYCKLCS